MYPTNHHFLQMSFLHTDRHLPQPGDILQDVQYLQTINTFISKTKLKANRPILLKDLTKRFTQLINDTYKLDQVKAFMFEDCILLYSFVMTQPHIESEDYVKMLGYLNARYDFVNSNENMGLLVGNLIMMKIHNAQDKNEVEVCNTAIDRIFAFSERDRSYCDFSRFLMVRVVHMIKYEFMAKEKISYTYDGWKCYERIAKKFDSYCESTETYLRSLWSALKFSEQRQQHDVMRLVDRIGEFSKLDNEQKTIHFYAFLYLLRFIINEHKHNRNYSEDFFANIGHLVNKLCYLPLNRTFRDMNPFLIMYGIVMGEKEIFGTVRHKVHFFLKAARYFSSAEDTFLEAKETLQEFDEHVNNDRDFAEIDVELFDKVENIASFSQLKDKPSQILSYGTPFDEHRKETFEKLEESQKVNPEKKLVLLKHQITPHLISHKSQIQRYADEKLQRHEYLQLYLNLEKIYNKFLEKMTWLHNEVIDPQKVAQYTKCLFTCYITAYMKILKQIRSRENFYLREGYMRNDFVEIFYREIIQRFGELNIMDIDFQWMYNIMYQEYTIENMIVFDFEQKARFGLGVIFQKIRKLDGIAGSTISMYETDMIYRYYRMCINQNVVYKAKGEMRTPIQRLIDKLLQKKLELTTFLTKKVDNTKTQSENQKDDQNEEQFQSFTPNYHESIEFPSIKEVSNRFIKTQIFRMAEKYILHKKISCGSDPYYQIFQCLVYSLDNEPLLLDIYANVVYWMLTSKDGDLVKITQDALALARKVLVKSSKELKLSQQTLHGLLCVFEYFRKIEIKRNRQKKKASSSSFTMSESGRTKIHSPTDNDTEQSKIYLLYFDKLFLSSPKELMEYGQKLFDLKKYKESIYVIQHVKIIMLQITKEFDKNNFEGLSEEMEEFYCMTIREIRDAAVVCDKVLLESYSMMVPEFASVKEFAQEKAVLDMMSEQQREDYEETTKFNLIKKQKPASKSLIVLLASNITRNYIKVQQKFKQPVNRNLYLDDDWIEDDRCQMRRFIGNSAYEVGKYAMENFKLVKNKDDLKQLYLNMVIGCIMVNWYIENCTKLAEEMFHKKERKGEEDISDGEDVIDEDEIRIDRIVKDTEQKTYDESLRQNIHLVQCPFNRLSVLQMMKRIEAERRAFNFQTIRLYYDSLIETQQMSRVFMHIQQETQHQRFEELGLLQLQILQKYFFTIENFQNVKSITRIMNHQSNVGMHGDQFKYFVNWPQVYMYDLISKLYDQNSLTDDNVWDRLKDLQLQVMGDNHCIVDGNRYSFEKLNSKKKLEEIKSVSIKTFNKISAELASRIKEYLKLFRIIFERLQLGENVGIYIMEILRQIYEKLFIPGLVSNELFVDFFLYYLRFTCEKINFESSFGTTFTSYEAYQGPKNIRKAMNINSGTKFIKQSIGALRWRIVDFLLKNMQFVKHQVHFMIRQMDEKVDTIKNIMIREVLVKILATNPIENVWTLAYLKNYKLIFPFRREDNCQLRRQGYKDPLGNKYTKKFEQHPWYQYQSDVEVNKIHDKTIRKLFEEVNTKLTQTAYDSYVEIPQLLLKWLERSVLDTVDVSGRIITQQEGYFKSRQNAEKEMNEIREKLMKGNARIPYPFNTKLWIKNVQNIKWMIGSGKSAPLMIDFCCGYYSEVTEDDLYTRKASLSSQQQKPNDARSTSVSMSVLLKNNYSRNDHRMQTNSANFYKQISILDPQTTYGIINLSKYMIMIEKIQISHIPLKQLLVEACNLGQEYQNQRYYFELPIRKRFSNNENLYEPKYFDYKNEKRKEQDGEHTPSLMRHFYVSEISKWKNIDQWWKYVHNFVRTLAQWSYLGYLTKLGDRHPSNILVSSSGKIMHIDFQYNFGVGLMLRKPQWVPFRLTGMLLDALGALKEKGLFLGYFSDLAKRFDRNDEVLWKALANFPRKNLLLIKQTSEFAECKLKTRMEDKCLFVIGLAKDASLLRMMFVGWQPEL